MKVSILTSSFPNGFTDDFIQCVKEHYFNTGSFVLIASDFTVHSKTDEHTNTFLKRFKDNGIIFNNTHIIDDRITKEMAIKYTKEADVIWISGGDTLKQIKYLKEYNLIPILQKKEGLTIGMSAGSINMAKRVVLPSTLNNNIPKLKIYEGIGLVDINIYPHLDSISDTGIKAIYEASRFTTIYGLYDNSFIKIIDGKMNIYGTHFKYKKSIC